jgi:hypothetical protein
VTDQLAGTVRRAIVPYAPAPPFRLYAGEQHKPIDAPLTALFARGGDTEFTFLVQGKARPVLVLTDPPPRHHEEVTALRLLRLSKLSPAERDAVREHRDELLFHLPPARFKLPEENAAIVSALVRLHVEAIEPAPSLGELTDDETRELGERVIQFYGFDTRALVDRRIRELAETRRRATGP